MGLRALWERLLSTLRPRGIEGAEEAAQMQKQPPNSAPPSPEVARLARSVDNFVDRTRIERESLEARLDRQLSLMSGGRFRPEEIEVEETPKPKRHPNRR